MRPRREGDYGVAREGLGSIGIRITYTVFQFLITVLLARWLGAEGLGRYSFCLALVGLLTILGQLGLPMYGVRMAAMYVAKGDRVSLGQLIRSAQVLVVLFGIPLTAVMSGVAYVLLDDVGLRAALMIAALLIVPLGLIEIQGGLLRGMGAVLLGQAAAHTVRPLATLILIGTAIVAALQPDVVTALLITLLAATVACCAGWYLLRRSRPDPGGELNGIAPSVLRGALPFLVLSGAQVVNYYADLVLLGLLAQEADVGLYRVGAQLVEGIGLPLVALTAVISTDIARRSSQADWYGIQRILINSHRAAVAMVLLLAVGLAAMGTILLHYLFGQEYIPAAPVVYVLSVGKVAYATVCFSGVAASMLGSASTASIFTALVAVLNAILNILLIPVWGILGAALATAISSVVVSFALARWLKEHYGINIAAWSRPRFHATRPTGA